MGDWEEVNHWEVDDFEEEDYPSTSEEMEEVGGEGDGGEREDGASSLGKRVGLGTALLLGATLGLGVGVSVAAVATIAHQHIKQKGPSLLEKLGLHGVAERVPLKSEKWCEKVDEEGKLANFESLLEEVSRGGICPSIRATVWPFLLGLVDVNSNAKEREEELSKLRKKYENLLDQCKKLHAELEGGSDQHENPKILQTEEYKENRRILNLDLVRTDFSSMTLSELDARTEGDSKDLGLDDHIDKAEYLTAEQKRCAKDMGKILLCYSIHDPQTGYCQGMTDLVQPFVQIFQDEATSFWAFSRFMESARENFMTDESGIMTKISLVKMVLADISQDVFSWLNEIGAESFFFVYRMILVQLRRELSIEDSMLFWEVLWAEDLARDMQGKADVPGFLIFSIVALIMERAGEITRNCKAESDVVHMFCNLKIDVWRMIEEARFVRKKWLLVGSSPG